MYGEVHVFVGKVLKSIDQSIGPAFFARRRFLFFYLFSGGFFRFLFFVYVYM